MRKNFPLLDSFDGREMETRGTDISIESKGGRTGRSYGNDTPSWYPDDNAGHRSAGASGVSWPEVH